MMSSSKIVEVVKFYEKSLLSMKEYARRDLKITHLVKMCQTVQEMLSKEAELDKVNRWLGFIQGVLWCEGLFSINEMREHNREPILTTPK
jgi:hypothetical protein